MKTKKLKRVLILGGNRFLGPRLTKLLFSKGYDVATFNRSGNPNQSGKHFAGDRDCASDLKRALSWLPDAIVDTSLYNPQQALILADAIGNREIRYLAISTASVYSDSSKLPWSEDATVEPHAGWGQYARDKMGAEQALQETLGAKIELVILRPVYFLGPGNPIKRCTYFFERASQNIDILVPGDGSALIQFVDIDHLTMVIADLLRSECTGILNVASTGPIRIEVFIRKCADLVTPRSRLIKCFTDAEIYDETLWPFPNLPLWVSVARLEAIVQSSELTIDEIVKREYDWWSGLPTQERKQIQTDRESMLVSRWMI